MCFVFGAAKRKTWGYLLCIPVRIHSPPVKGKPTSHRLLLGNVPHIPQHTNEAINDALHNGITNTLTSICRSPTAVWKLSPRSSSGFQSGISGMISSRTGTLPFQEFRGNEHTFTQEFQIHPLANKDLEIWNHQTKQHQEPPCSGIKRMSLFPLFIFPF